MCLYVYKDAFMKVKPKKDDVTSEVFPSLHRVSDLTWVCIFRELFMNDLLFVLSILNYDNDDILG